MNEPSLQTRLTIRKDGETRSGERPAPSVSEWLGEDFFEGALRRLERSRRRHDEEHSAIGVIVLTVLVAGLALGCATSSPAPLAPVNGYRPVDFASASIPGHTRPARGLGSVWPGEQYRSIVVDRRAAFVNDLVTLKIVEDSSAKGSAATKTARKSNLGMGISGFFGLEQSLAKQRPNMNLDTLVGAKTDNSFDGSGETTRTMSVLATMTCTVADVLPNGNLLIRGKRVIKVNGEDQVITISGIVRPEDIDVSNTIESTRVADANVTYWGVGVLADKQNPGWMTRALDNVWPF